MYSRKLTITTQDRKTSSITIGMPADSSMNSPYISVQNNGSTYNRLVWYPSYTYMAGYELRGIGTPMYPNSAATKEYVDGKAGTGEWHTYTSPANNWTCNHGDFYYGEIAVNMELHLAVITFSIGNLAYNSNVVVTIPSIPDKLAYNTINLVLGSIGSGPLLGSSDCSWNTNTATINFDFQNNSNGKIYCTYIVHTAY